MTYLDRTCIFRALWSDEHISIMTLSSIPVLHFQHQLTDNALDKLAGAVSSEAPCSARTLCTSAFAAAFVCECAGSVSLRGVG